MGCVVSASLRWPAVSLSAVLCMYGLEQWAQSGSQFFWTYGALTNYATGAIVLMAVVISFFRAEKSLSVNPKVAWVILALFGFALASVIWSVYPSATIAQWQHTAPYNLMFIVLCPLLITRAVNLRDGMIGTLALGSVVLILILLMSDRVGRGLVIAERQTGNPLAIATMASYVVLISLLMNFRGVGRFWQAIRWFLVAIAFVSALRSGSRGQFIGLLATTILFLPLSRRLTSIKGLFGTIVAVGLLAILALWAFNTYAAFSERWQWEEMVNAYQTGRMDRVADVLGYWASSSPIRWVIGLGSSGSYAPFVHGTYPEVAIVEILAEEGIIGLGLFLTMVVLSGRSFFRTYVRVAQFDNARGLLAVIGALFFFEFMLSFKQGTMLADPHLFAFAIMLGRYELVVERHQVSAATEAGVSAEFDHMRNTTTYTTTYTTT